MGGRIAGLDEAQGGDGEGGDDGEELSPELTQTLLEQDSTGGLLAIVKKDFLKNEKGSKGKGKGTKCGPRACFECGADDYLARACSVRLERVAAGGPERLDTDDPMKGV